MQLWQMDLMGWLVLEDGPELKIVSDIPSPFPAPVRCDFSGSGDGLQLSVWLRNGRRLDYFACAFPEELKSVYEHAWWPH